MNRLDLNLQQIVQASANQAPAIVPFVQTVPLAAGHLKTSPYEF